MQELREVNRFDAFDDDGNCYVIVERRVIVRFQPLRGPAQSLKGAKDYILDDGRDVSPIDDDTFRIVECGTILRRGA